MAAQPYTITRTRSGSTHDLGYHSLHDYTVSVRHGQPVSAPAPTGQVQNFYQGIADSFTSQPHHSARAAVASFVVGVLAGEVHARMRHRRQP